jgi:hypothetical protein
LETNAEGKVVRLIYGPDVKGIDSLIITAIESMVILSKHLIDLFKLPLDTQVEVFRSRLSDLGKKYLDSDKTAKSPAY